MKLHQSALVAGLLALGVAACGDDVTVVEPTPPPPPPLAATMAPGQAVVAVGNSAVFAVNTTGGAAGAAASWTCASSNTGIASVTTTAVGCQATGIAVGGVTITATVTKGTETTNVGAQLTVTDDAAAVVSINSINQGGVPAISPFGGQLDVVINVERGDQILSQLDLLVDGEIVASQTFAATAPAADDDAAEQVIQTITLSFNSALYDFVTGVVSYLNGNHIIAAALTVAGATTPIASNTIAVVFANADGYHVTSDLGDNTAMDGAGLLWWGGPTNGTIDISVLPVNYSGMTTESVSVAYCAAGAVTVGAAPLDFALSGAAGGACAGYETAGGPVVFAVTDAPVITSVQDGTVGPLVNMLPLPIPPGVPTFPLNADHGFPAPIEFLGPGAATFAENPNGRQNGWLNAAVGLTGLNTSGTDDDWLLNGAADGGVGGYNRWLRLDITAPGTVDAAVAATPSADPALPDPTVNNNDICAVVSATDDLGNESALPATGVSLACANPALGPGPTPVGSHLRAGVDIMVPTIAFTAASLAADARIWNPTVAGEFVVTVTDVGAVGNSGMLAGAPVIGRLETRSAAGTVCGGAGLPGTGSPCVNNATGIAGVLPVQATTGVAVLPVPLGPGAYYTFTALSQEAAGNQSGEISRVVVRDGSGALGVSLSVVVTPPAVPVTITGAFLASSFLNDDLSIWDYCWNAGFGGLLTVPATIRLAAAPTVVDAFNSASFTNTNFAVNTTANTFLGLQGSLVPYVAGAAPLSGVTLFARDQTQTATAPFVGPGYNASTPPPVAPTPPTTGIALANAVPLWAFTAYAAATTNAAICTGTAAACASPTFPSTVLSVAATGTTATFPNPFSRVYFYAADATTTDLRLIGMVAAGSATLVDDGATRVWTYSMTVTGPAFYAAIDGTGLTHTVAVYAFGVNAAGDVAMVSAAIAGGQTVNTGP